MHDLVGKRKLTVLAGNTTKEFSTKTDWYVPKGMYGGGKGFRDHSLISAMWKLNSVPWMFAVVTFYNRTETDSVLIQVRGDGQVSGTTP